VHFHYLYRSSHTFIRKFWIHVELVYQVFNLIFSWFALVRALSPSSCLFFCRLRASLLTTVYCSLVGNFSFLQANYYIAFAILSESMEDDSFHLKGIKIVNVILNYFYLGLLAMCFILSLGNRPQGSKWGYTAAMIGFSIITIYMTVCVALFLFSLLYFLLLCFLTRDLGCSVPPRLQGNRKPRKVEWAVDLWRHLHESDL
jgi:chitin synthase